MKAEARHKFPRNALKNFLFDLREEKKKNYRQYLCSQKKPKKKINP